MWGVFVEMGIHIERVGVVFVVVIVEYLVSFEELHL